MKWSGWGDETTAFTDADKPALRPFVREHLGADIATPGDVDGALRIVKSQVRRLEDDIDVMNTGLAPLESFVLPGGSAAVAALHLARAHPPRRARGRA